MHPEGDPVHTAQSQDASPAEGSVEVRNKYGQEAPGTEKGSPLRIRSVIHPGSATMKSLMVKGDESSHLD